MFTQVDRKSPEIMSALAIAQVFKKQGNVEGRPAVVGEKIATVLASGVTETNNTAKEGDWIMTNPSGEQYIIAEAKFLSRYEATETSGVYQAKGYCRAIKNPFSVPVEIIASWGSPQTGDENCMFADVCDADGNNMGGEPYIIEVNAFAETYK